MGGSVGFVVLLIQQFRGQSLPTCEVAMSKSFKNAIRVAELCAKGTPPFERERIHLCNWYVTLVRPGKELCDDQFQCIVPIKYVTIFTQFVSSFFFFFLSDGMLIEWL